MASVAEPKRVFISAQESIDQYGFKKGREIEISGMNLTAGKIALLMGKALEFANVNWARPAQAMQAFGKFQQFCREQDAELIFK